MTNNFLKIDEALEYFNYDLTEEQKSVVARELAILEKQGVKANYAVKMLHFIFKNNYQEWKTKVLQNDGISDKD